ncbi:MAG TPA: DEAD/DEAH box helicase [Mycobacteriales bacterium]|nr:DEAD/DEAH box helicase [Mycobacteriales bacterium]
MSLLQHQKDALAFLRRRNWRGALFLEPGLGKSRVALEAARHARRTLVVAPPNPVELVWPEQGELWAADMNVTPVIGTPKERERILLDVRPRVAVLSYSLSHWLYDLVVLKRRLPYDLLVLDEANAIKNPNSVAFRVFKALDDAFDAVIPMTGSPAENSLADIYGPLYFIDKGKALGSKIGVFREWFCRPKVRENYVRWEVSRPEELRRTAAPLCIVRRVRDCLDMPPLQFQDVRFHLSERERRFVDSIDRKGIVPLSTPFVCANTGVAYEKMRQVSSGFVYEGEGEEKVAHHLGTSKYDALVECLEEAQGRPMFIGYWFRESARLINGAYGFLTGERFPVLDGDTPADEKRRILALWKRGELPGLLGQIGSVATGTNMQSPSAGIVFYDLPWSHGLHFQFIRRVWRYGQNTPVVVRRLIGAGTKDAYVARVLKKKETDEGDFFEEVLREELI